MPSVAQPTGVVEHLFRHSSGRLIATLARLLGPDRLDLAEEAVADALEQALRTWPHSGVPNNPRGWLFRAARNRAVDLLRRERSLRDKLPALVELDHAALDGDSGQDDELAMMLLCCHPDLPVPAQVALTLRTVGGLGVREIAAALLTKPATVAQRLTRAKRWLRNSGQPLELPPPEAVPARVDTVLSVLYLLFNEGYGATSGEAAVRAELCGEAIRLSRLLLTDRRTDVPRARALLALMLLQASRLPARVDERGDLLLFDEQDRGRWDRSMIAEGTRMFAAACVGAERSAYHVEAAIALCHAAAEKPGDTDWPRIVELYDQLLTLRPSPVTRLNRAIALAMVDGPEAGIAELERLGAEPRLREYPQLPAALGALWSRAGRPDLAAEHYRRALELPVSAPQHRFLRRRLAECG
ncbi:RNA polymerase sigma-70 factor, ECF subfamily [Amycolatopsis arida]|uniref:RNA polymerase sigma-70 factor, ECF subfamily n=1 Tax=Amycolatopsis arida TaxID=587909 RepID=A0A1I5TEI3_9PSEU|nr:sigma-70 family RNA polymerase sigma factor [Amycolatopsis arida]TDX96142.1 RNA polymerase sigma-70 factor (ECF subfamily) [Amycolatopsis arida]SFP80836.1 RNA polymerase sigma-70 factor, ECF subfamily [Amycolatopsis arida]